MSKEEDFSDDIYVLKKSRRNFYGPALTAINVAIFFFTIILIQFRGSKNANPISDPRYSRPDLNVALKQLSSYSPLLDIIDIGNQVVQFDGTFFNNASIYRHDPSPEVDAAWEFFDKDILIISSETVRKAHKDPSKSIKVEPKWGLGNDAYLGTYDVFHQIHCLNTLRKEIHYSYYWGNSPPSELHASHRNHCLHMLLQTLICHADLDVITYEWVYVNNQKSGAREYSPWPDFNIAKTCRNFDDVFRWAQQNAPKNEAQLHDEIQKPDEAPARYLYDT